MIKPTCGYTHRSVFVLYTGREGISQSEEGEFTPFVQLQCDTHNSERLLRYTHFLERTKTCF